ncbi:MAG TPA: methyltransferase [Pseudonocardia sp.]|nr:methyltransferase [Pseudonocardia sp.]
MPIPTAERPAPVTQRRELSHIAYGFMASKALFAALEIDLFTHLAGGSRTAAELATVTGVAPNRLRTLLHALVGLGLATVDPHGYANAPACQRYLVHGAPDDFGDYFRLQISRQIYPALVHLDEGIAGTGEAFHTLGGLLSHPTDARTFTRAQHAGSLASARVLAERVDLTEARGMLDVGGGSGAFSIALCAHNPALGATVLDFPSVLDIAREYREEAGLADRITLLAGDAVHIAWPPNQDVVLLSYLLSALGAEEIDVVLAKAHACLRPGGLLIVHDFMLDDDRSGPALAALWFLQYVAYRHDGVSFTADDLAARLGTLGFTSPSRDVLIPEITKVLLSRKVTRP